MKVEIRASGGDTCPECGATEVIRTPDNELVEHDFLELVETHVREREHKLLGYWRKDRMSASELLQSEIRRLSDDYERELDEMLQHRAKKYRFFVRRAQARFEREARERIAAMRGETRK